MGRSLALPNSFFLQFTNNDSTEQTLNLFNQGGANQTQISINQTINTRKNLDLVQTGFMDLSGNLLIQTTFLLYDAFPIGNVLNSTILNAGQNISLLNTLLNPVVGTNGQTGYLTVSQQPIPQLVEFTIGAANAKAIGVFDTIVGSGFVAGTSETTASFVTTNPLVLVGGTIGYNEILNSQTGNAYKIMGMDIYSNSPNQLLQDIQYGNKDANGDRYLIGSTPTIDPYQPSRASIQSVDSQGFTIDSETLFSYNVESFTFVRLTFNYVRAQLSVMKEFDQAFVQQLTMESDKLKRILNLDDASRYILFQ